MCAWCVLLKYTCHCAVHDPPCCVKKCSIPCQFITEDRVCDYEDYGYLAS